MVPSHEYCSFALLCAEDNESILGFDDEDEEGCGQRSNLVSEPKRCNLDGDFCVDFPLQTDECVALLVESESEHLPREGFVERLKSGDLDLSIRTNAIDWICKVHAHFNFGPLTVCLAINYLDRFLSVNNIPLDFPWTKQLLSVACLSLAVKMEETEILFTQNLQVVDVKYVFDAGTIQRMELLVLNSLKWRMQATTPFSFIDFFLHKFNGDNGPTKSSVARSVELILCTSRGNDFIEFRPSEIAAAIALSVIGEIQAVDVEQAMSCCILVAKEAVLKCYEAIQDMVMMKSITIKDGRPSVSSVPLSPIGVLDAACLSYNSDDRTVSSHATTFHQNSPASKRRKIVRSVS